MSIKVRNSSCSPYAQVSLGIYRIYLKCQKKNFFKPKNIMKLSTSIRCAKEAAKSLKIGTSGLEIEAKEVDCTPRTLRVLFHFSKHFTCIQRFLFSWGIKLQRQLASRKYAKHLLMLEIYTWDLVRANYFDFYWVRILE